MAVRLDSARAEGKDISMNFNLDNVNNLNLALNDNVFNYRNTLQAKADSSFLMSRADLQHVLTGQVKMADLIKTKKVIGNAAKLDDIMACLDQFELWINIVTPN
ncbi:hypothetical protein DLR11_10030 [Salmonella enterica subsp. salamae]|uniref:Alkyl/aryl-sulfatase BDS1 n=3 Tax=Salmonella enterica TaxID=28901 RepID=A0A379QSA3_SALER|nr:hypothetical protein LFZ47_22035 [Salmonella enterica subsp. salamae serovar 55:k:z39 str. 1315K]ECC1481977.1 hypothetical protein [Salmonella enterica subsp. salamae]EEL7719862.1 hypothetical protein [Salmonella enterica]HCM1999775.1 hypothetical protein [Salmonella enterica subsp. salamae serovar [1],40:z35:e,n,x,z15]ECC1656129.1 hypothetical protein [Salmonella enterica subsp. salamae]